MGISAPSDRIVADAPRRRGHTRRIGALERLTENTARRVVAIECDVIDATAELVYQRDDLTEAASPTNNELLERALAVHGLPALARELIQAALLVEVAEDAAARRAERRRSQAHDSTREATRGCEELLTGTEATP